MNENYVNSVRKSLYSKVNKKKPDSHKKNSNKINVSEEINNSENFFTVPHTKNKPKIKNKRNNSFSSSNDMSPEASKSFDGRRKQRKKVKKQKVEIDCTLSPSTSETFDFTIEQKSRTSKRTKIKKIDSSIIDSDDTDFDLNQFFSTRDQSFDASMIEPHCGIDYEFLSNGIRDVTIRSSKIYEGHKHVKKQYREVQSQEEECSSAVNSPVVTDDVDIRIDIENIKNKSDTITNIAQDNAVSKEMSSTIPSTESFITEDKTVLNTPIGQNKDTVIVKNETRCRYFDLGHQKLVILKEKQSVPCYGLCRLKVLHGQLEVLGYKLDKSSDEVKIYSPRGSSLLFVTNITDEDEVIDFEKIRPIFNSKETLKDLKVEKTCVVFICSKIDDCAFLEKYISQQIFPKAENSESPQIIFDPREKFNIVKINPEWNPILNYVTASTKLLITGGKGVGKSTFLRYCINTLLNRFEKVRIVDLDPGQSEFSIPGCISVLTVSEPVLGPNYTHLRKTDRSYLSNIDIGHEPRKYLKCVKSLMESVGLVDDIPTLINYMGFAQGIGLNIVSSAITFIKPSDIVQIDSKNSKKNFKTDLTPRTVRESCSLFGGDSNNLEFKLLKISAMSDDNYGWSLEPRQVREMCVLTYFGELMKNGIDSLASHHLPMYKINLNSIKITDDQGRNIPSAAINANLVALCSGIDDEESFNTLGYGVVRGIDLQSKMLVLITPEPIDVLENVFYLVLGSVFLPPSVYMTPNGIGGSIPYVMEGELESLGQITKRSYIPAYKK